MNHITLKQILTTTLFVVLLLFSFASFADNGVTTFPVADLPPLVTSGGLGSSRNIAVSSDAQAYREKLVAVSILVGQALSIFLGMILLVMACTRAAAYSEQSSSNKQITTSSIIMLFVCGVMLVSYTSTLGTLITTISGEKGDGVCYVVESSTDVKIKSQSSCWTNATSEISGSLDKTISSKFGNSEATEAFQNNMKVIVGLFQAIGFFFFISSIMSLKAVGHGSSRDGYAKPMIILIASALIIDLPHTASMIMETAKLAGVDF